MIHNRQGKACHLATRRQSFRRLMATSIGYGSRLGSREDSKTRKTTRGRSFFSTRRPVPSAIQPFDSIGNERLPPTEKVGWIPRQESQMEPGSPSLRALASREPRSELQEVMRTENLVHLGFFRFAMEFKVSRRVAICRSPDGMFCDTGIRLHRSFGKP